MRKSGEVLKKLSGHTNGVFDSNSILRPKNFVIKNFSKLPQIFYWFSFSLFMSLPASIHRHPAKRSAQEAHQTQQLHLPEGHQRAALLSSSVDRRLREVRLGLDYSAEAIWRKLLRRRMSNSVHAAIRTHPRGAVEHGRESMLLTAKNVRDAAAVFRCESQHHSRHDSAHDRRGLLLLVNSCCFFFCVQNYHQKIFTLNCH